EQHPNLRRLVGVWWGGTGAENGKKSGGSFLLVSGHELVLSGAKHPQRFVAGGFELAVVAFELVHRRVHHPDVGRHAVVLEIGSVVVRLGRIPDDGERAWRANRSAVDE